MGKLIKHSEAQRLIDECEKSIRVRRLELATIEEAIARVEQEPPLCLLPQRLHYGAYLQFAPHLRLPRSYRYSTTRPVVCLRRTSRGWVVDSVDRKTAWPSSPAIWNVSITPEAAQAARAKFDSLYSVEED